LEQLRSTTPAYHGTLDFIPHPKRMSAHRTLAQLRNHFLVEKELADRLRAATRAERPALYATLYQELFERVPDHPRLTRRDTESECIKAVNARLRFVERFLTPETDFLEIAPGDCRFAFAVAAKARKVFAADISDQSGTPHKPANFELVIYDGCHLAFSYQFLEHIHPEEVPDHFHMVYEALRPGGRYVLDTPHRYSGPHDISRYFSNTPEGFHLKEWTHGELARIAMNAGFSRVEVARHSIARLGRPGWHMLLLLESLLAVVPHKLRRVLFGRVLSSVSLICTK
jgi:SAM-dependent methyltransferase